MIIRNPTRLLILWFIFDLYTIDRARFRVYFFFLLFLFFMIQSHKAIIAVDATQVGSLKNRIFNLLGRDPVRQCEGST